MVKIFIVTPWFGSAIPGGMESEARRTAAHLQSAGYQVEVVTTCIRDFFSSWDKNYHRPGLTHENEIPVRRFRVQPTNRSAFQWASWRLQQGQHLSKEEELDYGREMIQCPELFLYIASQGSNPLFIFIPYLFPTTFMGAKIRPQNSILIPCLHDESYAYLDIIKESLSEVKALVLHSEAELGLVEKLVGPSSDQIRRVIGEGVDTQFESDGHRFRNKFGITSPFVLAAGRRDRGKNTPLLLNYWRRFVREFQPDLKLVLIGPGDVAIEPDLQDDVIDLGFVDVQDKHDAYSAAAIICQPSVNESFSLVIMEAWLAETAVLVHGHCAVTKEHCVRSNGGLYFTTYAEFAATLCYLIANEVERVKMGRNGRRYVLDNYQWPMVIEKYRGLIGEMQNEG